MGIAKCYSAHLIGLAAETVTVEVDISNGLNAVSIVGLGDRAVEEARDRVSAAIKNSGFASPKQKNQKVVISLAPADTRKEGPAFDLPIALAYLLASREISFDPEGTILIGELSLEGEIRHTTGVLPILCGARSLGFKRAVVPLADAAEAALVSGIDAVAVRTLTEAIRHVTGEEPHAPAARAAAGAIAPSLQGGCDMRSIRGNATAKRALEIAASGGHNVLLHGPPGGGKTMLARSLPTIMPPLSPEEAIEVTGIHSAARALKGGLIVHPPFRSPHHTASYPAVVGGGALPRPGEITLAHRGVLFLDELPEFSREVMEALRQPLEDRSITISRAKGTLSFPARFMLIASMNPCPCGKPLDKGCKCSAKEVRDYSRRVSGPIMDRFDMCIRVADIDYEKMSAAASDAEQSEKIRSRVIDARSRQNERRSRLGMRNGLNSDLGPDELDRSVSLEPDARAALASAASRLSLSGRAFHRVMRVGRTIADLAASETVSAAHIMEALSYRQNIDLSAG